MAAQLYKDFADLPELERVRDYILNEIFGKIKQGVVDLSKSSFKIEGADSAAELKKVLEELKNKEKELADQAKRLAETQSQLQLLMSQTASGAKAQSDQYKGLSDVLSVNIQRQIQLKDRLAEIGDSLKKLSEFKKAAKDSAEFNAEIEKLTAEQAQLKIELQSTNKLINNQVKEFNAASGSIDEQRAKLNQLNQTYDALSNAQRDTDSGKALLQQITDLDAKLKELEGSTGRFSRNVGNYAGSLSGAFEKVKQEIAKLKKEQEVLNSAQSQRTVIPGFQTSQQQAERLNQVNSALQQLNTTAEIGFKVTGNYTQQVKQLENAYIGLATSGNVSEEFLQTFRQEIGNVKDDVNDLRDSIRLAASDTQGLDILIGAAQGIAGGFAVAQGAAALFGDESEELQKTMVKLNALMTILNGLQSIQEELKKKDNILTTIQIGLQKTYAIVVGSSTGAMKAFRIALAATGIGAVIILIAALVENMDAFSNSATKAAEAQKQLREEQEAFAQSLDKQVSSSEKIRNNKKGELDDLKRELQIKEATGKKDKELLDLKLKIADKELYNLKVRRDSFDQSIDAEKEYYVDASKLVKDKEAEILAIKAEFIKLTKSQSEEAAKKQQQINERNAKALFDIEQLGIDSRIRAAEKIVNNEDEDYEKRLKAVQNYVDAKTEKINSEYDFEVKKTGLTSKEIELIEAKKQDNLNELAIEGAEKRAEVTSSNNAKIKQFLEKLSTDSQAHQQSIHETELQNIQNKYDEELVQLDKQFATKRIKEDEYNKKRLDFELQLQKDLLAEDIKFTKESIKLAEARALASGKQEDIDAVASAKSKLAALELNLIKLVTDAEIDSNKRTEESAQALFDKQLSNLEKRSAIANELFNIASGFIGAAADKEKNQLQEQIDLLEKKKQLEIEAVNQSVGGAEQKAAKIKIIEAKAEAQRQQLELKKRQADEKRAKFEKAANIASIIQETSLAVVRALGARPFTPANIALASVVGAIGAAKLAVAVATPIPKFFKGTESSPEGLAEVAERGPELAIDRKGNAKVFEKHQLTYLTKGTKIYPADVTKKIMMATEIERSQIIRNINNDMRVTVPQNTELIERTDTVINQLKELNRKSRIIINNQTPIETTAWFIQHFKS